MFEFKVLGSCSGGSLLDLCHSVYWPLGFWPALDVLPLYCISYFGHSLWVLLNFSCPFCREAFDNKFNVAVENEMDDYARFPRGEPGPSWQPVPTCRPGWTACCPARNHRTCCMRNPTPMHRTLMKLPVKNARNLRLREVKSLHQSHTANGLQNKIRIPLPLFLFWPK